MTLRIKLSHLVVGLAVGALLIGAGYALATTRSTIIRACVNSKTRALTVPASGRCARGSRALSWNQRGPRGSRGARGARGATGAAGASATVRVGSVTTESAGSAATVSDTGTANHAVLNFGIPQGVAGQNGTNATNTGPTAFGEVWMGSSSAELAPGSNNRNVDEVGGGGGVAAVGVSGCSSPGLAEPVVSATAVDDAANNLAGSHSAATEAAYVTGWSTSGSLLIFDVTTYNAAGGSSANADFSFTVYC